MVHEVSGVDTTTAVDVYDACIAGGQNVLPGTDAIFTGETPPALGVTTTADGDYLFGAFCGNYNVSTQTAGTDFTGREDTNTADVAFLFSEDRIQASAAADTRAYMTSGADSYYYISQMVTLKAAAAATASSPGPPATCRTGRG